jgi:hypothetical protein
MERENVKVKIIRWRGELIALFPLIEWNNYGEIACYAHCGQHGGASMTLLQCKAITKGKHYQALVDELESIGYNVEIVK